MLTKIHIAITIILLLLIIGAIFKIKDLNNTIDEQDTNISLLKQNERALKDQIDMKTDSLFTYAIFVDDLQHTIEKKTEDYNILASKYSIAIDSIKVLNKPTTVDTSDNTIVISFEGRKGKVTYRGNTTYFKLTGEGTYSIDIGIDTTVITTLIYIDSSNTIRNKVYADGNLITQAETVIDSAVYSLLQGITSEDQTPLGVFDRLKATFELNQLILNKDGIYKADQFDFNVGIEYQLNNNLEIYGNRKVLNPGYNFGIKYKPSFKNILKSIF